MHRLRSSGLCWKACEARMSPRRPAQEDAAPDRVILSPVPNGCRPFGSPCVFAYFNRLKPMGVWCSLQMASRRPRKGKRCLASSRCTSSPVAFPNPSTSWGIRPKTLGMCVKQHLVSLAGIGSQEKRPTGTQLPVGQHDLAPHPSYYHPFFAPVKLECIPTLKCSGTNA